MCKENTGMEILSYLTRVIKTSGHPPTDELLIDAQSSSVSALKTESTSVLRTGYLFIESTPIFNKKKRKIKEEKKGKRNILCMNMCYYCANH